MHLRERLVEIKSILTLDIANAKSVEGNPHFSNEATRNAELVLRLQHDEDAKQMKEMLDRADERRARLSAHVELLRGEFKLHLLDRQAEITHRGASLIA
ncbi:MAG: hypothetical protein M3R15_24950 [Acidobacteriota bacterium]|nr:hypothetical protein [Acidobacteriota bacterium]